MKRREFLLGSAGALGVVAPALVSGQIPCPVPSVRANSGTPVTSPCMSASGALHEACAALQPGQSVNFPAGAQSAFGEASLAWQTAFYHDDINGLVHLMGKPANADRAWEHQYYTISTGKWTVVGTGMWNNSGHIYGNLTMDFTTGDLFISRATQGSDNPRRLRWYKRLQGTWDIAPVSRDIYTGAMENHANGIGFHPNLYGPGDGGAIWNEQARVHFWRKSTDAVESVGYTYGTYGEKEGVNVYWPAKDVVLVGGSSGGALLRITPNSKPGGTPVLTNMGKPPVSAGGHSYLNKTGFASLHVHPGNPNKLLLLETNGQRVWTSTDGSSWTQTGTHPFNRMPRVVCSLRGGLGCFWAIGRDSSGHFSILWKPDV